MGHVMNEKEKQEWMAKTIAEKENDPEYQKRLKDALKREKERLLAIADQHKKGR